MTLIQTIGLGVALAASMVGMVQAEDAVALEVVITKPKAGATLEQVLEADKAVDAFVRARPGFVSREVGISADGEVFILVHWATLADAEAAGAAFMADPAGQAAMATGDASVFKHYVVQ